MMAQNRKSPLAEHIGKRIISRRQEVEITQHRLSVIAGISVSGLAQIERGHCEPTAGTLWRLSRSLGVEIGYFFGEFDGRL